MVYHWRDGAQYWRDGALYPYYSPCYTVSHRTARTSSIRWAQLRPWAQPLRRGSEARKLFQIPEETPLSRA